MLSLKDKTVVVIGCGSGIARAIEDITAAGLAPLTNGFLTVVFVPVDRGEHLV